MCVVTNITHLPLMLRMKRVFVYMYIYACTFEHTCGHPYVRTYVRTSSVRAFVCTYTCMRAVHICANIGMSRIVDLVPVQFIVGDVWKFSLGLMMSQKHTHTPSDAV